jgi:hypothetical protein
MLSLKLKEPSLRRPALLRELPLRWLAVNRWEDTFKMVQDLLSPVRCNRLSNDSTAIKGQTKKKQDTLEVTVISPTRR